MSQKRKEFWIDTPIQLQVMAFVMAAVTAAVLFAAFMIHSRIHEVSTQSKQIFHSLDWIDETMLPPLALSAAISILASAVLTLIWSHRFAGPLRVLSAAMRRLRDGNLASPVRVRETDALQSLVKDFEGMQEGLRGLVADDREALEALGREARDIGEALPKDHPARPRLAALSEKLGGIGSRFKL